METRWYSAKVIHGFKNGSKFGFPTANLEFETPPCLQNGSYKTVVDVDGKLYKGMLYAGTRPTLNLTGTTFEVHILNFSGCLYGKTVRICFLGFLREEIRFKDVESLVEQLESDRRRTENEIDLDVFSSQNFYD